MDSRKARAALMLTALLGAAAPALAVDVDVIERITGQKPDVSNGVAKVSRPRDDLSVTVDGVKMKPFQGLTSWAAFQESEKQAIVMGDLTLAEDEVSRVMSTALESGLEVTALHNHFSFDHPRIMFMHIGGTGDLEELARAVRKTFDAIERRTSEPATTFDSVPVPTASSLDATPLERILDAAAQTKDGMAKFVFEKKTRAHGQELGTPMGVNTWAVFAGTPAAAVVDGDFAMVESELQPVLRALRGAGIHVVAIHNHMVHEEPRIIFLHYWAKGPSEELARGLRKALDAQRK